MEIISIFSNKFIYVNYLYNIILKYNKKNDKIKLKIINYIYNNDNL
jgi:hypothetical protein